MKKPIARSNIRYIDPKSDIRKE